MEPLDHKLERQKDVEKIKSSKHPRKVVVAGPGTGKSFLFQELIKEKRAEGKKNFVAITFIGKLGDALADDLCGLAETTTMHGYARSFVLNKCKGWSYYPNMYQIIQEDLRSEGITEFNIGDENYKKKSAYYKAVGDADVIYYAVQICRKGEDNIPQHDLILIDEFQDFNEIESEFVDFLSSKNEIVIVGDDDQALYEFKGSSPTYIREKHDGENKYFESHTLRFCSRCTEVIIKYFHAIVDAYKLNHPSKRRIEKEYISYIPDKAKDSKANPKIHLIKNCPTGMMAYQIKSELTSLVQSQKIKEILVIGEARSCKSLLTMIAKQLRNSGFKNVEYNWGDDLVKTNQEVIDAYKMLYKDSKSLLGWRILGNPADKHEREEHIKNAKTLNVVISGAPSKVAQISQVNFKNLKAQIEKDYASDSDIRKLLLIREIKEKNNNLPRPLGNLNITICNILNSKGLGADVVFVVGFDKGKFPAKDVADDSEIYQMLVALTRAKKRIYFINSTGIAVSGFINCVDKADLVTTTIN